MSLAMSEQQAMFKSPQGDCDFFNNKSSVMNISFCGPASRTEAIIAMTLPWVFRKLHLV